MAALSAVLTVVSGAFSAIGAIQQANAAQASAEYNAKVAERNRVIADQNRQLAIQTAEIDASDKRRENARTLSTIRAAYGKSGLEMAGSPLDVMEDSALELELDTQRIAYEGRARGREGAIQMQEFSERATLSRMEGRSAKSAGILSAFGYLAGSAGTALSRVN